VPAKGRMIKQSTAKDEKAKEGVEITWGLESFYPVPCCNDAPCTGFASNDANPYSTSLHVSSMPMRLGQRVL
jgi:hypothetical protein